MSCSNFESDIALYAGGDLPDRRLARVEQHLAGCAVCQELLQDLHVLVGGLRDEPVEDFMLAKVRRQVFADIHKSRASWWYWRLAFAAALVLAAILVWPRHRPALRIVATVPQTPSVTAALPPAPRRGPAALKRRRPRVRKPGTPLLVQFVTSDPNIVIYWLVEQKGQGD